MSHSLALPHTNQGVDFASPLSRAIEKASSYLLSHQYPAGYWWYTLEANETIGAGFVQIMHFLDDVDPIIQNGLVQRILQQQKEDGSWSLFYGGIGDLSTTIECYFALRLASIPPSSLPLEKARHFILLHGGLTPARIFTRIHLALFGIVPWSSCPSMPIWFCLLPPWSGVSIYEFSSWARASIVPLLIVDAMKPIHPLPFRLDELFAEPEGQRKFRFPKPKGTFSLGNFFILFDQLLKVFDHFPWHPGKKMALRKAERWVREHLERTEDIYPAMAYGILALKALGYSNQDPTLQKALNGLKQFQQKEKDGTVHQQCCISPHWDTPWVGLSLLEAGVDPKDPRLLKAGRYLLSQEIRDFKGDWKWKNPKGSAGGWSFEFQNDCFPDVDDAIEAIFFLQKGALPQEETNGAIQRGLAWILSMQSQNGGWAAFDKNNLSGWVNKIPFADHGACLDPPTPDITGRMIELLASFGYDPSHPVIQRAFSFLKLTQEPFGAWRGRWGVSYIYGTWCVLQGLASMRTDPEREKAIQRGVMWLQSIQNADGGWGESCLSDSAKRFIPLGVSVPSQTAWAVMGFMAGGKVNSMMVKRGVEWLLKNQKEDGGWEEPYFTGTGFPGHFYLKYHGYQYYFPLLALARFQIRGSRHVL